MVPGPAHTWLAGKRGTFPGPGATPIHGVGVPTEAQPAVRGAASSIGVPGRPRQGLDAPRALTSLGVLWDQTPAAPRARGHEPHVRCDIIRAQTSHFVARGNITLQWVVFLKEKLYSTFICLVLQPRRRQCRCSLPSVCRSEITFAHPSMFVRAIRVFCRGASSLFRV